MTLKSDTWSFGCILLQIITGIKPYDQIKSIENLKKIVIDDRVSPLNYCINNMRKEYEIIVDNPVLRILLWKCFDYNFMTRPSAMELSKD